MPNPRWLLTGSSVLFCLMGGAGLFVPEELGAVVGLEAGSFVVIPLAAAGFLAMAVLNWMGRGAIYGGIYGRPIVLANLTFGFVSAGVLVSALLDGALNPWFWAPALLLALHALAFGRLMRAPPWKDKAGGPAG